KRSAWRGTFPQSSPQKHQKVLSSIVQGLRRGSPTTCAPERQIAKMANCAVLICSGGSALGSLATTQYSGWSLGTGHYTWHEAGSFANGSYGMWSVLYQSSGSSAYSASEHDELRITIGLGGTFTSGGTKSNAGTFGSSGASSSGNSSGS